MARKKRSKPAIKATTYKNWRRSLLKLEPRLVNVLDFTDFIEAHGYDALDEIYPKQENNGKLDPPQEYLATGTLVRQWRGCSQIKQEREIERIQKVLGRSRPKKQQKRNLGNCRSDCECITTQTINKSKCTDKTNILKGFFHLIGKAHRRKGHVISTTGEWNHGDDVVGFLTDHNTNTLRCGDSNSSWKCVQAGTNQWEFHINDCDDSTSINKECCKRCWKMRFPFYNLCRGEVEALKQAEEGVTVLKGRHDGMKFSSSSIVVPRLEAEQNNKKLKSSIRMMENGKEAINPNDNEGGATHSRATNTAVVGATTDNAAAAASSSISTQTAVAQLEDKKRQTTNRAMAEDATENGSGGSRKAAVPTTDPMENDQGATALVSLAKKPNGNYSAATANGAQISPSASVVGLTNDTPKNNSTNKRRTNWRCDICRNAVFDDYDRCAAHEKECTVIVGDDATSKKKKAMQQTTTEGRET